MDTDPRSGMYKKWIRILDLSCRKVVPRSGMKKKMGTDPRSVMYWSVPGN